MNRYSILIIFFQILLVSSCYKEVNFENNDFKEKLVLYGTITQDSLITVDVELLQKISDTNTAFVPEATVNLYIDNVFKEKMIYDSAGIFRSNVVAKQGSMYKIEAFYKDIPKITAQTMIPGAPKIQKMSIIYYSGTLSTGEPASQLIISMKDISNENNYYMLSKIRDSIFYVTQTIPKDPVLLSGEHLYSTYLFDDQLFKNGVANLQLLIDRYESDTLNYNIVLTSLTKDAYKYENSLLDYYVSVNNYFNMEPVPATLYTNVTNGYGIFYGYMEIRDSLKYIRKKYY